MSEALPSTPTLEALRALERALDLPHGQGIMLGNWRWAVRQRLVVVRDRLVAETYGASDGWLCERGNRLFHERSSLVARLRLAVRHALEAPDPETIRRDDKRLIADISRHLQRVNDLAYDDVELELGGSE